MTTMTYPSREVILNIIAAGGWEYVERREGVHYLRSPNGFEYALPHWQDFPPHAVAWDYYTELNRFDKIPA